MLDAAEKNSAAEKVFSILEKTAAFMLADRILMYHSLPDELSTHKFIDRWASKKHFYLPRVNGVNLDILPYDETRLSLGSFQIEEPTGDDTTDINDIELIPFIFHCSGFCSYSDTCIITYMLMSS